MPKCENYGAKKWEAIHELYYGRDACPLNNQLQSCHTAVYGRRRYLHVNVQSLTCTYPSCW